MYHSDVSRPMERSDEYCTTIVLKKHQTLVGERDGDDNDNGDGSHGNGNGDGDHGNHYGFYGNQWTLPTLIFIYHVYIVRAPDIMGRCYVINSYTTYI